MGLSSAVLEGWKEAKGDIFGVMDADLSHPINKIHELYYSIKGGKGDLSIGTRYMKGGKIKGWNFKRKLMSRGATWLAKPFTGIRDPMSGFFMIKKECLEGVDLNPKGFKILLEVVLKAKHKNILEIPIVFTDRERGKSKAGFKEIIYYVKNLMGYWKYRRKVVDQFLKFSVVGFLGTIINIGFLYLFTEFFNFFYLISATFSFIISVFNNYLLNKVWTFKDGLKRGLLVKGTKFFFVSFVSLIVNLFFLYLFTNVLGMYYLLSQVFAILISLFINFFGNKLWTFKK